MKKLSAFLFVVIITNSKAFEAPSYCEAYDDIYAIKADKNADLTADSNNVLYSGCDTTANSLLSVEVTDLVSSWGKINDSYIKSKEKVYQDELTKYAVHNLAKRASSFIGLGGSKTIALDDSLKSCLDGLGNGQSDFIKETMDQHKDNNKEMTDEFINSSFDKAVLIQSLLKVKKKREELLKETKNDDEKDALEEANLKVTESIDNLMKQMSTVDPFLLSSENDFSVWNWFDSKIIPSDLNNTLVGDFPSELSDKLVEGLMQDTDLINVGNFSKLYGEDLRDEIADYKKTQLQKRETSINREINNSVNQYLEESNKAMLASCQSQGQDLHFNNQLVESMAQDFLGNPNLSKEEKEEELIGLHAWQCYRWRQNPYVDSNGLSWKEVGGFAGMGAGFLLTLSSPITGVGAVAGPYLMMASGGLLAYNGVEEFYINKKNLNQEELGYLMGWRDLMELNKSRDTRSDIVSNIATDVILMGGGAALRVVKVPSLLRTGKVAKNASTREATTMNESVDNYTDLILRRHSKLAPDAPKQEGINANLRAVSGNRTVARMYMKEDEDFLPMLKIVSDPKTKVVDRDEAFKDLYSKMKDFKNYPSSIRESVRTGVNIEEMVKANKVYMKALKGSHFKTPGGPLPKLDPPYELAWSKNDTITLTYKSSVWKDGKEVMDIHVEDFSKYQHFVKFVEDTKTAHQDVFSFSMIDEASRSSNIFGVMDDQARLYRELHMTRDSLIDAGKNIDRTTGKYPNLSDRQNGAIHQLNELLKEPNLMPRQDAYNALLRKEMNSEIRGIMTGNISFRGRGGKYGDEARELAKSGLPSIGRKLAPLGLVTVGGLGGTGMALNSLSERVGARGPIEHFNEALREVSRKKNDIFYSDAPVRFTDSEADCARALRAWSVKNDCLLNLIVNQVIVRERIQDQYDPTYDMATDPQLGRKVRAYVSDFYKLREYLAVGKAAQLAQNLMDGAAEERADAELRKFFRESALQNGLEILDKDGVFSKDIGDELREQLTQYNDNPDEAKEAYTKILDAYAKYNGQVIQSPELTPQLRAAINRYLANEAKTDLDTKEETPVQ